MTLKLGWVLFFFKFILHLGDLVCASPLNVYFIVARWQLAVSVALLLINTCLCIQIIFIFSIVGHIVSSNLPSETCQLLGWHNCFWCQHICIYITLKENWRNVTGLYYNPKYIWFVYFLSVFNYLLLSLCVQICDRWIRNKTIKCQVSSFSNKLTG